MSINVYAGGNILVVALGWAYFQGQNNGRHFFTCAALYYSCVSAFVSSGWAGTLGWYLLALTTNGRLLRGTYLGVDGRELQASLAVNPAGNLLVTDEGTMVLYGIFLPGASVGYWGILFCCHFRTCPPSGKCHGAGVGGNWQGVPLVYNKMRCEQEKRSGVFASYGASWSSDSVSAAYYINEGIHCFGDGGQFCACVGT